MSWIGAIPPSGESDWRGSATGFGELDLGDGWVYKGDWKDGSFHGQGEIRYDNGDVYKGGFKEDYRHGQGTMTWGADDSIWGTKAGDSYTGAWNNDNMHGQGTMTRADGTVESGRWEGCKLVAPSTKQHRTASRSPRHTPLVTPTELERIKTISHASLKVRNTQDDRGFKGGYLRAGCNSIAHLEEVVRVAGCNRVQVNQAFVNAALDTDDAAAHGISPNLLDWLKASMAKVKQSYLAEHRWSHPAGAGGRYVYNSKKPPSFKVTWRKTETAPAPTASNPGGIRGRVEAIKTTLNIDTPSSQMMNVVHEANAMLELPSTGSLPQQIAELFSKLGL